MIQNNQPKKRKIYKSKKKSSVEERNEPTSKIVQETITKQVSANGSYPEQTSGLNLIKDDFNQMDQNSLNQFLFQLLNKKHNERINYLSLKEHPNFHEYMKIKNNNTVIPNNCIHVNMAYMVYLKQENCKEDPTETGRKIKRAHYFVN